MKIEEQYSNTKSKISSEIKSYVYDIISIIIILAIIMASLDALGMVDLTDKNARKEIFNFVLQWIPYFMAAILLSNTLYQKGSFIGKKTDTYINNAKIYSNIVNDLTGDQIKGLYPFCDNYNIDTLKDIQTQILKKEGITYEDFTTDFTKIITKKKRNKKTKEIIEEKKTINCKALVKCTCKELKEYDYNMAQIFAIIKAKKAKVKGLSVNSLLSSINVKDRTNIGKNEHELAVSQSIKSIISFIFSTLCMCLITVKDLSTWGWAGLIVVIFKVAYVFARCYMSYFKGYNDVTIYLVSHIARKSDILKMYLKYVPKNDEVKEIITTEVVENNTEII